MEVAFQLIRCKFTATHQCVRTAPELSTSATEKAAILVAGGSAVTVQCGYGPALAMLTGSAVQRVSMKTTVSADHSCFNEEAGVQ